MDPIFVADELYSVDMAELGVRPLNWMDVDETMDNYLGIGKPVQLNVFPAELHLVNNNRKLTTNEDDLSMVKDDDETNDYIIDPETGERVFQKNTSFSLPTDKWLEEYILKIESSSSDELLSNPKSTTENSDTILEGLSFPMLENIVDQSSTSQWLSELFQLDENSDQTVFDDLLDSVQLASPFPTSSSDEHHQEPIEQDENEVKLEKIDPDEDLIPHLRVRRTSIRSTAQSQQDDDILQQHNIPLTVNDITQSSTDEYNRCLARLSYLSSEQLHIIKDIRRRGKNKIAAQNCRKRKAIGVESLVGDVDELKRMKHDLEERKRLIQQQIIETRNQYEYLHRQALPNRLLPPAIVVQ